MGAVVQVVTLAPSPAPSVGVTVTGLGATPTVFNVWRTAAGRRTLIRGGGNRETVDSDYVIDDEVPFNIVASYDVEIISGPTITQPTTAASITVPSTRGWLQDPLVPGSAIAIDATHRTDGAPVLRATALSELMYAADVSLMQVIGSTDPVALIGQRASASGVDFDMVTKAAEQSNNLRDLIMSGGPLLIRPVAPWGNSLPPLCYIAAAGVSELPKRAQLGDDTVDWLIKAPLIKGPSMDVLVPRWTWGDVEALYATWQQIETALAGKTWLDVIKSPSGA
ncbi:hypothetical protein [Arthrobacter sp. GMC3]|uniref:hypothetical protein n=1 Tax=Arthrobacter sp. GMC3 TaxID=2058894 RepID=UPI000CE47CED|nr:hypothetical protein [Arthrobacter sp. GMC3]